MNRTDREPLTPEERLLADRLAGDGSAASPSAALDAAILGAARNDSGAAPAQTRAATAHRTVSPRRRRWPLAAGMAASVALAVGIAWQLRPVPDSEMRAASEMPAAAPAAATAPSPEVLGSREVTPPPPVESAPLPAQAATDVPAPAASAADEAPPAASTRHETVATESSDRASSAAAAEVQAPVERSTAFGAEMHPAAAPPPPPAIPASVPSVPAPPPAPPSPPAPMQAPAESAARRAAPTAPAPAAARQTRAESQALVLESIDDAPDDGDPPASADAPEVRAAWLARVRELLDAGRIGEAKASLAEFHRRHPQAELPPDLRALLD